MVLLVSSVASALHSQVLDTEARRASYDGPRPKYIMFFIGDGFGMAQSFAAEAYLGSAKDGVQTSALTLNSLPVYGAISTHAQNRLITDSAAAGTALATGYKTTVNTISMDGPRVNALRTVAEAARDKGLKVGIVTSVSIDHATPAVFYAHQPDRNMYYHIALDLSASGFDYFGGGGFMEPDGESDGVVDRLKQNTGLDNAKQGAGEANCLTIASSRGYSYVDDEVAFRALRNGAGKVIATAPRLVSGEALPYAIDRREGELSLADFTAKGIELLAGPQGFFMMVEGGKIDWSCHANDAATTVHEVIDFDMAVRAGLDFYQANPADTLIIVTADHETGGMGVGFAGTKYDGNISVLRRQKLSYEVVSQKVAAYRDANPAGGSFDEVMDMLEENFGLGDAAAGLGLSPLELNQLRTAFEDSMRNSAPKDPVSKALYYLNYGDYEPIVAAACRILAEKAGVSWTSYSHTAVPVPVRAIGPGSELFSGAMDNTDMARNIFFLLGEPLPASK